MIDRLIVPSLRAADFSRLGAEVKRVQQAGADRLHLDIMDGAFVPDITFGSVVVEAIRPKTTLPFDVHLMVEHPAAFIAVLARIGAERLIVHVESHHAEGDVHRTLAAVRSAGCEVGLAINPETSIEHVSDFFDAIDLLLIMTVRPGRGGQQLIPATVEKIEAAYVCRETYRFSFRIGVDGGINLRTAPAVLNAGADTLVCGTGLFRAPSMSRAMRDLRSLVGRESAITA